MKWFGRRRKANDRDLNREVGELLDSYNERTSVDEPYGTRVTFAPGKIIDNLRDRMERVILDPLVELSVVDFISEDDAALMFKRRTRPRTH